MQHAVQSFSGVHSRRQYYIQISSPFGPSAVLGSESLTQSSQNTGTASHMSHFNMSKLTQSFIQILTLYIPGF